MSSYPQHYTAAALAASVAVVTISDSVALMPDDLDIDTALAVADDDRIAAAEMAVDSVDYYLYRDIAADKTLEVLEVDRSTHLQRLGPMLHNFVHTAFVVAAVFVAAG